MLAALGIRQQLREQWHTLAAGGADPLRVGIGLHTGHVAVGEGGTSSAPGTVLVGDTVTQRRWHCKSGPRQGASCAVRSRRACYGKRVVSWLSHHCQRLDRQPRCTLTRSWDVLGGVDQPCWPSRLLSGVPVSWPRCTRHRPRSKRVRDTWSALWVSPVWGSRGSCRSSAGVCGGARISMCAGAACRMARQHPISQCLPSCGTPVASPMRTVLW